MYNQLTIPEQNSKLLKFSFGPLSYHLTDAPSAYQTGSLSRPPSVPVLGRRLSSESILTVKDENESKYPYAVDVSMKKLVKNKSQTRINPKIQKFKPKLVEFKKKIMKNIPSNNVSPLTRPAKHKIFRPVNAFKTSRNGSPMKNEKTPEKKRLNADIREIVEKSLKKQKKIQKIKEKNEKLKIEAKEKLKQDIKNLNVCAREENLKHFKQKLFNPRQPWGIDDKHHQKSTERKKEQPLEVLNQLPKRISNSKRSKNHTPEISPCKRSQSSRPEIKECIKKQRPSHKKSKDPKKRSEKENKKFPHSKNLNLPSKKQIHKKKPKKKVEQKPILKKCQEFKWLDRYLENMSEFSHGTENKSNKSDLLNENKKSLGFGVIDNFKLFSTDQDEVNKNKPLNDLPGPSFTLLEQFDMNKSSEFILEENSKILRLKKKNLEKEERLKNEEKLKIERKNEELMESKENDEERIQSQHDFKEITKVKYMDQDYLSDKEEEVLQNDEFSQGSLISDGSRQDGIKDLEEKIQNKGEIIHAQNSSNISKIKESEELNKEKTDRVKKIIIEEYLFEKCVRTFQVIAKGWIARNEVLNREVSENLEDRSEKSYSWIFRKLYPSNSDSDSDSISFQENEDFGKILKVFSIKPEKPSKPDEKQSNMPNKAQFTNEKPKNFIEITEKPLQSDSNSIKTSAIPYQSSKNTNKPRQIIKESDKKPEIVQLSPIVQGHNLNLSEISNRLMQEQQNLDLLEEESKDIESVLTPKSPELIERPLRISPENCSEEEIFKLFHEIIQKKYSSLDNVLEKNILAIKEALADSLSSKSKSESLEFRKKLEKISNDDNGEDLDQILKDLIGTQDILNIEAEIMQDYLSSFPGSRNSPIPLETPFKYPDPSQKHSENLDLPFFPHKSLEDILSQRSTPIEAPHSPVSSFLTKLEPLILSDLILQSLDDFATNFTESLIFSLLDNEIILINEEFHQAMSEENLSIFTNQILHKFGPDIFIELKQDHIEDPLEILAMMQESEIGSGQYYNNLEAVIDPKAFLEVINEDPLQVCIYKKMIFDCVNEFLNKFVSREPWPWSLECKNFKGVEIDEVFEKVKSKIAKFNDVKIGRIFGVSFENTQAVIQAREERILKALDVENKEGEFDWVSYLFEEDQVKLDVADMLLEELVDEAVFIF